MERKTLASCDAEDKMRNLWTHLSGKLCAQRSCNVTTRRIWVILKWVSGKQSAEERSGFRWIRIRFNGQLLRMRYLTLHVFKITIFLDWFSISLTRKCDEVRRDVTQCSLKRFTVPVSTPSFPKVLSRDFSFARFTLLPWIR